MPTHVRISYCMIKIIAKENGEIFADVQKNIKCTFQIILKISINMHTQYIIYINYKSENKNMRCFSVFVACLMS